MRHGGFVKVQWEPRASSQGGLSHPVCLSPAALQSLQTFPSHHLKPKYFLDQALQMLALVSSSISKALLGGGRVIGPEKEGMQLQKRLQEPGENAEIK